jgi:triacylglycerol lipase
MNANHDDMRWLLNEAINTPLPTLPKPARLLSSFRPSMHPPPFFNSLTRSTLPTASLSPPLSVQHHPSDKIRPPPIVLLQSPPVHSSVDSLRSVHTRSFSTLSEIDSASTPSFSRWWSDNLFSQEQIPDQKEILKKKCKFVLSFHLHPILTAIQTSLLAIQLYFVMDYLASILSPSAPP